MFSEITPDLSGPINPLYRERNRILSAGQTYIDLISGNPHQAGIFFPQTVFSEIMSRALRKAKAYRPHPLGQPEARQAIQTYYTEGGIDASHQAVLLTPGTSISYWYCFNLFANPGDEILCPKPSYPLFETIARLCRIKLKAYPLKLFEKPSFSVSQMESQIGPKTKAIVLISPHNPTGIILDEAQLEAISDVAKKYNLPVISDEVFSEFIFNVPRLPRIASGKAPLVVTLNGFSKMYSLPGLKLGWMLFTGNNKNVRQALETLEMISDTFLPVGEIAQFAVPGLFKFGKKFLKRSVKKINQWKNQAVKMLAAEPNLTVLEPDSGCYMTMKVNDSVESFDEEQFVLDLLKKNRVLIHPGFYYDMEPGHLVMSFVAPTKKIQMGIIQLTRRINKNKQSTREILEKR